MSIQEDAGIADDVAQCGSKIHRAITEQVGNGTINNIDVLVERACLNQSFLQVEGRAVDIGILVGAFHITGRCSEDGSAIGITAGFYPLLLHRIQVQFAVRVDVLITPDGSAICAQRVLVQGNGFAIPCLHLTRTSIAIDRIGKQERIGGGRSAQ